MNTSSVTDRYQETIALYSCYHQAAHLISSDIVIPIQVGAACAKQALPMLKDSDGENISDKNPHFCELTATYWIWKNATADIVGLFHYRRFLNLSTDLRKALLPNDNLLKEHGITRERILEIMESCDAILPCPVLSKGKSPLKLYAERHHGSDLELCSELICQKYPDMAETAKSVLNDSRSLGYFANVIVCRKPLFDEYAAWLFDILFEVERRLHADVLTRSAYEQRAYGFLSERLMTIFIAHKVKTAGLRVGEAPLLQVTDNPEVWKRYIGKRQRHRFLKFIGINKRTWEENTKSTI